MSRERNRIKYGVFCGICPDIKCHSKLIFTHFDANIQCTHCGQQHHRNSLIGVQEVSGEDAHVSDMIRELLMSTIVAPKHGTETVKVLGLSNYHCKLLSPLLTKYGMEKSTGKAKLLSEMNQGEIFDCGVFGDRAFLIDPEHISVPGYGRDISGSMGYLSQTLELIKRVNDGEERLLPIHADGDGHCLVHAVSRALVGRELFWHPLRCSLKKHFEDNLKLYQELFKDFVDESDWGHIIEECDPDFVPPEGEILGLRNIHVFGLANVLKRPIILLDSLECMNSLGDYAALFLPSLISPELCRGKNNRLNKPLCIAWSSPGHNHYIPLVGIKKKPLPVLPVDMLPKAWGVPQSQILTYMEFDEGSYCTVGGERNLADSYVMRLVSAMEELFLEKYGVHPGLVADVHHYLYQNAGVVSSDRETVVQNTKRAIQEGRLYRCLKCDAVCEQVIKPQWFCAGGVLYNMALLQYGTFVHNQLYPFPLHGIVCRYDAQKKELVPDLARSSLENCTWCNNKTVRKIRADGGVVYKNEDKTRTPTNSSSCGCGFKHYWCGKEYDNPPKKLNVILEWNNQVLRDTVVWFQDESDPSLNSNVYEVATEVVQKHFPGEFGSERLIQRVVEQLLSQTKPRGITSCDSESEDNDPIQTSHVPASKIIMGGTGVLHKEELGHSRTEEQILQRIQEHAEIMQRRSEVAKKNKVNKAASLSPQPSLQIIEKSNVQAEKIMKMEPSLQESIMRDAASESNQPSPEIIGKSNTQSEQSVKVESFQYEKAAKVVTPGNTQPNSGIMEKGNAQAEDSMDTDTPLREKIVRVATSDGKQGTLVLGEEGITYDNLQLWVQKQFHIHPSQQRLKHGFPPQELQVIEGPLPLAHGDRVTVEVLQDQSYLPSEIDLFPLATSQNNAESKEVENRNLVNQFLREMSNIRESEPTEMQMLLSAILGVGSQPLWDQSKRNPHMFQHGGAYYEYVVHNYGLTNGEHYSIPSLPNKLFSYNEKRDSLELCSGNKHFVINEDVDSTILKAKRSYFYSGYFTSCNLQHPGSDKDSQNLKINEDSDAELQSETQSLIRRGPGYSVLGSSGVSSQMKANKLEAVANQLSRASKQVFVYEPTIVPDLSIQKVEGTEEAKDIAANCDIPSPSASCVRPSPKTSDCCSEDDSSAASDHAQECDSSKMDCT